MSVFILGTKEVVTAFALGGLKGQVVSGRREVLDVLERDDFLATVRILVVQEEIAALARDEIDRLKLAAEAPLVVEVPGLSGPDPARQAARDLIRRALGIRI